MNETPHGEQEAVAPKSLQTPRTWGDLRALNTLVPSYFCNQRYEALAGDNRVMFGHLDTMLATAVWSRKEGDNPNEDLPEDLVRAARQFLEIMGIHGQEHVMRTDRVTSMAVNFWGALKERFGNTAASR